ncbi:MAG: ABC transporter permease [Methanobacteriota archaeon]|nr:MAG: ABC transporter permease [Euryarchaeota archaeon]
MVAETISRGFGLGRPGAGASLGVIWSVFKARIKIITRYKGAILLESLIPIIFAGLPILLGTAVAGGEQNAATNFFTYTHTTTTTGQTLTAADFRLYMLMGSNTFMVVSLMLWLIGYWVRREQETGTLEALYLAPAKRFYVLAGVTSYTLVRSLMAFVVATVLGSLLFNVNPLSGPFAAALLYLLLGIPALWGISFFFGAVVMRIKEANSVIQLLQWVLASAMGVYFPVTVFPVFLRWTAMAFPPTLMTDAIRSTLLPIESIYGAWYVVLGLMLTAAWLVPLLGYQFFRRVERKVRRDQGVGQF